MGIGAIIRQSLGRGSGSAGSVPVVSLSRSVWSDPLPYFSALERTDAPLVRMKLGPQSVYFVNDPDVVRHIFRDNHKNYRKSNIYKKLKPLLGDGLFTTEGSAWARQRRIAQPAFGGERLKSMFSPMRQAVGDLVSNWHRIGSQGGQVEGMRAATNLTLEIVLEALFGVKISAIDAPRFNAALTTILSEGERRVWSANPFPGLLPSRRDRAFRAALREIEEIVAAFDGFEGARSANASGGGCPLHKVDLLGRLLGEASRRGWTPRARKILRDEIVSFVVAGHETTANTLAWAFLHLAERPDLRDALAAEAEKAYGDNPMSFEDLANLPLARAVMQETLRLYPPVWCFSRQTVNADKVAGINVRRGAYFMVCAYTLQRSERYWDQPLEFKPERFLGSGTADPFVYFPFGGGARMCLGNRFAQMEGTIALSMIAREFDWSIQADGPVKPRAMVTLRPDRDVWLKPVARRRLLPADMADAA